MGKKIYVETYISAPIDKLWLYTQSPDLHQQWDLRFSEIIYIPKNNEDERQKFLYKTNIGFGVSIAGDGESYGSKESKGILTSSLRFSSDQPISLISEGSGFWRYIPTNEGVKFLTLYDYKTRFGILGRIVDRVAFRPLIGWATAWSFDALRLWLEQGIHPSNSMKHFAQAMLIRFSLFFIWIYQGLIPKLLVQDSGELDIVRNIAMFQGYESILLAIVGVVEILFGVIFLLVRGRAYRILHIINIIALIALAISVAAQQHILVAPFNPITLNIALITLSIVSLLSSSPIASASNCRRQATTNEVKS
ncbi:DoxX-like family protein [Paenibacillus endoradicis]|uniref:DoxX-like family protein n=1 Tax=Paenibacillus endoradicis TaxID=2972487 RepID=UPI00215986C7|nr:DoxX-like family protein [Paenibacillus endoradicis]MCR8659908.1 DoxX-like family protein [Paenibacillus endoradicis]